MPKIPPSLLLLAITAGLVAQEAQPPAPRQSIKVEIRVGEGKDAVVLSAKRPELAARANLWTREKFWRMSFPSTQPTVPAGLITFTAAIDPNDLPGGGLYVCVLKLDGDKIYLNSTADSNGGPKDDFIFVKPSNIASSRNADGTVTFKVLKALKPGPYAIFAPDNQYVWPFVAK